MYRERGDTHEYNMYLSELTREPNSDGKVAPQLRCWFAAEAARAMPGNIHHWHRP